MVDSSFIEKAKKAIDKHRMLKRNERVVLGVSGGPDSVALLILFLELKKEYSLYLHIAHLNHALRGKESDDDEAFVKKLTEKFKLPITVKKLDIEKEAAKLGRGIEETARIARYDFFSETAEKEKCQKIAVAHTQDDQAETVLMRLIRGSGLGGLYGIAPVRALDAKLVIRPLIDISRREIEKFLVKNKMTARHDSS
ncbi:MAG: tRNA lysidine(34) synthetase TilS, partial [Candidatus Omnitrophota bacterium]